MHKIYVIGVNDNLDELASSNVLKNDLPIFTGNTHKERLSEMGLTSHDITPIAESVNKIKELLAQTDVIVLASGDPLFYGIGSTLLRYFESENIIIKPTTSSIQRAASLFRISWQDGKIVSLHGKNHPHIAGKILQNHKSFILTDNVNTPDDIARKIKQYIEEIDAVELSENIVFHVAENIGREEQKIITGSIEEIASQNFAPLNVLIVVNENKQKNSPAFGLTEDDINHSRGLITKSEVRAASLHALSLPRQGTLWDVGGGSGSISIEAAGLCPEATIFTIEQKDEELLNIKSNIKKFGRYNIISKSGRAEEVIKTLPKPDRIFVGGSGGAIENIIQHASKVLPQNGIIVVNSVLEKTAIDAKQHMQSYGFNIQISKISVERDDHKFNTITIIRGVKK